MYHVSSRRQTLCDILNLHGHVRENQPVLLRFFSHPLRIMALASICYILSKLNSQSTTTLAINLKHQINTSFARSHVKALLRVVLLVLARFTTLTPSSTPLGLLTVAICSSIDSFLEELSITFDLTCTKKLSSFWLKALKELYLYLSFFYLMLAFHGCIVNIGISDSFSVLGSFE
ncbi:hypothetical protein ISN45_Aa01g032010 [Arabidopsis thaliana x Arabidopsis arenosa]|uniref:Uncharacterized protein n=1 Tax=Arabidopsis thaliana x Arabidopsis arenosa TaxID=1240361 RepID=A0A8T2C7Z9_9BRAS|nr:hypothetical protein ISN45_Aa01g032010 [Arabidopsis thaliana x Arabidopsis arenosa]